MSKEEGYFFQDILHLLTFSRRKRMALFRDLPVNSRGRVLLELSSRVRDSIVRELDVHEIVSILHYVDLDQVARILRHSKERRRKKILKSFHEDVQEKVEFLLRFSPDTAAGLMDLNYITVEVDSSFKEVFQAVESHEKKTGKPPAILVLKRGFLVGELPLHRVELRRRSENIESFIRKVPTLQYDKSEKEVLDVFRGHPHSKIIVLDDDRSVLGVIYSSDILRIIEKKSGESLYGFAGVRKEEDVFDTVWAKVRNRHLWLLVNLGTVFLAVFVVGLFETTISKFVLLAAYMPVVAGMGGNAGTQTLAVVIRGLAFRKIGLLVGLQVAWREVLAGIFNGVITGVIVALVAFLWHQNIFLGLVVAVSLVFNLIIAGFFGTMAPLFMTWLGKDPASSASILITTATDVIGFFVFLGLASLFLV
ncbi:magnesium transporter MgtE [bacterium]|nr:magnesium transporter MgtE [bacterium]|tara:strand:- start:3164 stop:4426 length:1263 start_codon:yes stop_codon:yes gene_type:complete